MTRFQKKRKRPAGGWKPHLLEIAQEIYGDIDPEETSYSEFLQQIVKKHLAEIAKTPTTPIPKRDGNT